MAFDLKSIKKNTAIAAPRVTVYGVEGIGKSTFAAAAPNPIFILTEDGLGSLQVEHFPIAKKPGDVLDSIQALYDGDHDFRTVVIDSLDWLETLIWREIESTHDAKDLAYGKGALIAAEKWRQVLDGLNALRNDKGMICILIAHTEIKRFDSPEVEPYDRYQPKLQTRSSALVREWSDAVLFANYRTIVKTPERSIVRKVSYTDNPWFPAVLKQEADALLKADPEAFAHVWGGKPWARSDAQVLAGKWRVMDFAPDKGWQGPYFGADWGFSHDPTVLIKCYTHDNRLYLDYEAGGIQLDTDALVRAFDSVPDARAFVIRADSARPEGRAYQRCVSSNK